MLTSIDPVRGGPWFGPTVKLIVPLPPPAVADVMLMNESVVDAVHEQPLGCPMLKLPVPPVTGNACTLGEIVTRQALVEVCSVTAQVAAMLP